MSLVLYLIHMLIEQNYGHFEMKEELPIFLDTKIVVRLSLP